ncbi:AMP-binding protein [Agarivorans gilvus]|uniref:Aconitate hydratase n=1 Tax=Agarivorans gilvus TaxID=680279 RepID=A0ABQ1I4G0_9ALTE|nr:class I adenylate-forming enzyme family protein [Agarivorans gilvus]GGB07968.1 aconitate hydratase [Agarivorans gilvus]
MNEIMLPPQNIDYSLALRETNLSNQYWWQQLAAKWLQFSRYPQQRWLLFAEDSFDFSYCLFALLLAGKTPVLAPNKQAETLAKLLGKVDAVCADVAVENAPLQLDTGANASAEAVDLSNIGAEIAGELELHLYTSGSTGEPKLVVKRWRQLLAEVETLERQFGPQLEHSLICSSVSHQHIYGLLFTVLWPVLARRCWRVKPLVYPEDYCALAAQPISLVSSPSFLAHLSLQPELAAKPPQFYLSSGGPLKTETLERLLALWQQAPSEVFGSSETGGVAYRNQKIHRYWKPFSCIEWRIASSTALQIRSPYLLDPAEWYQMDDAVAPQEDGFNLQGRLDRVVKIAEKRVCLEQMTQVLSAHPWIQHCDLFTLQSAREYIAAVVVLSEAGRAALAAGKLALNKQFRQHLSGHFETVTLPRRWRYVDQAMVNSQGKRQLQAMKELFQ